MINQTYSFHIFVTKNRSSNNIKALKFNFEKVSPTKLFKKYCITFKQKKYVRGSAVPRVFWAYPVHVPGPGL